MNKWQRKEWRRVQKYLEDEKQKKFWEEVGIASYDRAIKRLKETDNK